MEKYDRNTRENMKFVNESIVFQEIPDEVTLAINISNCPCRCPGCHSKYLWSDNGEELTHDIIDKMIEKYEGSITCVSFMGGDATVSDVNDMAIYIKNIHSELKVAWYTGRTVISPVLIKDCFDYIKVGPYIEHLGPLNRRTTNQRMYKRTARGEWEDITPRFWRE